MTPSLPKQFRVTITFLFALVFSACGQLLGPAPVPTSTPTPVSTPTETPVPLTVRVHGMGIPAAEFEAELARYQQAQASLGITVSLETATQTVKNNLIDTLLLEQGASAQGYGVDDATVQSRIETLAAQVGGSDALAAWESAHGYTDPGFRSELRRQIAAAWMRDQITASVPNTAEQVHVKQILLDNAGDAQQALGYLQSGWNFNDLAAQYQQVTKGELGWFPRGYLLDQAIEEA